MSDCARIAEHNRRDALKTMLLAGTAAAAAMSGVAPALAAGAAGGTEMAASFDDPSWNLDAIARINGAGPGKMAVWWARGRVFGMPAGAMREPILGITGCRMVQYDRAPDGYSVLTRDFAFFTDLTTGEPVTSFDNPYTDKAVAVRPILTPKNIWKLTPAGQMLPDAYRGVTSSLTDKPFKLAWMLVDGVAYGNLETFIRYPSGMVGSEVLTFRSRLQEIQNKRIASVPSTFTWVNESGWFSWLDMADKPGGILMVSSGAKVDGLAALPPDLQRVTRTIFPGLLEAPWTWQRPAPKLGAVTIPGEHA